MNNPYDIVFHFLTAKSIGEAHARRQKELDFSDEELKAMREGTNKILAEPDVSNHLTIRCLDFMTAINAGRSHEAVAAISSVYMAGIFDGVSAYMALLKETETASDAPAPAKFDEETDNIIKAVDWILNDANYKAPEQLGHVAQKWLARLKTARKDPNEVAAESEANSIDAQKGDGPTNG